LIVAVVVVTDHVEVDESGRVGVDVDVDVVGDARQRSPYA